MNRQLLIDFDGTLIDSRKRQFELFIELAGETTLSLEEYWKAKRRGINQNDMLKKYTQLGPDDMGAFMGKWMESIEDFHRLNKDVLIAGVPVFLEQASKKFSLYLVTGRQSRELLIDQLLKMNIYRYFTGVLNTAQRSAKADLVHASIEVSEGDIFIGDSGEDIVAGKALGLFTVGVASGASSSERLAKYLPDLIVGSVAELDPQTLGVN